MKTQRKAKIVCTIGPVSGSERMIEKLILAGMDVARLNFSHGDHQFHGQLIERIRKIAGKLDRHVAILQDLQGIKIRVGELQNGKVRLVKGSELTIRTGKGRGDDRCIYIDFPWLIEDAKVRDRILLDDGLICLEVLKKSGGSLITSVVEGGILKERKGVNLPSMKVSAPFFTEKDRQDLEFGIGMDVDYVALSFVRSAKDIIVVKRWLNKKGVFIPLIAKIEKGEAIRDIDRILDEVDGLMVARGDLGVEMPLEEVPMFQKMLIEKANRKGRLVITATQMLESMTQHMRPTRAETTDVANAVIDGTDALMLSAETSAGKYPIESVKAMDSIITFTENSKASAMQQRENAPMGSVIQKFSGAVAHAASKAAGEVGARWIVVFTRSGFTARLISKFRPETPVIAFSPEHKVIRQVALYWGVTAYPVEHFANTDDLIRGVDSMLVKLGCAKRGDRVVIVASHPPSVSGKTNLMKIHQLT
ncbi:MAG: Pyruvate kinase [Syntrophorhabdus sp. PtaU1.Bin058]|nr:MAG: Pyruvate kinase [Syntrophorhabdus sp. PtaU1.Bin058]